MSRDAFKNVYLGSDTSGLDISDRISYLSFVNSTKKDDGLSLYAKGEDAAYLLELEELKNGKPVIFNFGYIGAETSPTFRAIITDIEPTYSADGGISLNIKCGDKGRAMRHARSKKVWKKKNTGQIFKEVADMYNMGLYLEVPVGGFMQWASLPQGSLDYMNFLQTLAAKEKDGNYICFVSGNDLHLVTRNVGETSTNTIEVGQYDNLIEFSIKYSETTAPTGLNEVGTAFGKVNARNAADNIVTGELGVYTQSGSLYLKDRSGRRTLLIDDEGRKTDVAKSIFKPEALKDLNASITPKSGTPQTKTKVSETRIEIPKERLPTLLTDDAAGKASITNGYELITPSAQAEEETINSASSIHKEATHKVLTASLKEMGNPFRKPNTVITVLGVATRFIGNWLIEAVQHDVGESNYTTTLACSKNGVKKGGVKTSGTNTTEGKAGVTDDRVYIGIQGADNARAFERDPQGNKKTIEYHPPKQ